MRCKVVDLLCMLTHKPRPEGVEEELMEIENAVFDGDEVVVEKEESEEKIIKPSKENK
jgi:hypothetical protein